VKLLLHRKSSAPGPSQAAGRWPVVVWVHDGPVCVTIIDEDRAPPESACRCGGCHCCGERPDFADQFLPD
jgi:hypothetical protein